MADASDCGGRLGPAGPEGQPDLRNLNLYYQECTAGDIVLIVSDGVHDNLDPSSLHISPSMVQEQLLPEESRDPSLVDVEWSELNQDKGSALKDLYMTHLLKSEISSLEKKTAATMTQQLLAYCSKVISSSRTWMEENPGKRLPVDSDEFIGKMDHTTGLTSSFTSHIFTDVSVSLSALKFFFFSLSSRRVYRWQLPGGRQ